MPTAKKVVKKKTITKKVVKANARMQPAKTKQSKVATKKALPKKQTTKTMAKRPLTKVATKKSLPKKQASKVTTKKPLSKKQAPPVTAAKNNWRLPRVAVPEHYQISLQPDLKNKTFTGNVEIAVNINKSTDKIVLNAKEIQISQALLFDQGEKENKAKNFLRQRQGICFSYFCQTY